jgi:hypothetical protein
MMRTLEDRYRRVLLLLPADHRQVWEESMVASFLERARTGDPDVDENHADFGRPSSAELARVLTLAVRLRLGGSDAPPRARTWGNGVRMATLVALLTNALLFVIATEQDLLIASPLPLPAAVEKALSPARPLAGGHLELHWLGAAWIGAYLATVYGHPKRAWGCAFFAVIPTFVAALVTSTGVARDWSRTEGGTLTSCSLLVIAVAVVLSLAAFHPHAPAVSARPWRQAFVVGVLFAPIPALLFLLQPGSRIWLDGPGLLCLAWTLAFIQRRRNRPTHEDLALTLLVVPVVLLRLTSLVDGRTAAFDGLTLLLGWLEMGVVVACAVPVAIRARRRMPPPPPPSSRSSVGDAE